MVGGGQSGLGTNFGNHAPKMQDAPFPASAPSQDPLQALSDLLSRTPREVECRDFQLPEPPSNPMVFGKWKDDLYLLASSNVKKDAGGVIKWLSQVEHAMSVEELAGDASPFSAVDAILKYQVQKRLNGLQLVQYKLFG